VFGFVFALQAVMTNMDLLTVDLVASLKIYYPPIGFLIAGFAEYDWLMLLVFIAVSVVPFALLLLLMSVFYRKIWSKSQTVKRSKNRNITMTQNKQIVTLVKKEFARFFSSPNYILNSSIGVVLFTILSVASIFSSNTISALLSVEGLDLPILPILMIAATFCTVVSVTTAPSISLEGKSLFIAKTVPVDAKLIFLAKLICNWVVVAPFLLADNIILAIVFKLGFSGFIILFFVPLAFCVLLSTVGIFANIKWHKFDWKSDYNAVKNSMSVLMTILGGYALLLTFGLIYYFASGVISFEVFAAICFLIISAGAGILLYILMKNSKRFLDNL